MNPKKAFTCDALLRKLEVGSNWGFPQALVPTQCEPTLGTQGQHHSQDPAASSQHSAGLSSPRPRSLFPNLQNKRVLQDDFSFPVLTWTLNKFPCKVSCPTVGTTSYTPAHPLCSAYLLQNKSPKKHLFFHCCSLTTYGDQLKCLFTFASRILVPQLWVCMSRFSNRMCR